MNHDIAEEALTHYDIIGDTQLHFIGQSQNTTFRVETSKNEKFLLRLHTGIDANDSSPSDVWQEKPVIRSELLWLNALRKDTELVVPQPIRNHVGEWVTEVRTTSSRQPCRCTLLRWIDGEHIETEPTPEQVFLLGLLIAQLHQHASQWEQPSDFTRPHHDTVQLQGSLLKLRLLTEQGIISTSDYEVLQASVSKIAQLTLDLERNPNNWGIVYADLQDANYIFHQGKIRPIDFGRCGFGFYLYDVALSLSYLRTSLHEHLLKGYENVRSLSNNYEPIVEAFFLSSIVENFAFLCANPEEHKAIAESVPLDVEYYFRPYVKGEVFLFKK